MSKSTKQRWHTTVRQAMVYDEDGTVVAHLVDTGTDCCRIVADHNACIGIQDPETTVPALVAACQSLCRYVRSQEQEKRNRAFEAYHYDDVCEPMPEDATPDALVEAEAVLAKTKPKADDPQELQEPQHARY